MDFAIPISQNLKKFIKSLQSKKEREETGLFVAEGEKICSELLSSDYNAELILLKGNANYEAMQIAEKFYSRKIPVYIARKQQFEQLCETKSPQDILAVVKAIPNGLHLKDGVHSQNFIALDGIADPGNLGTIIRTADWFGFKHIILGGNSVDRFNGKSVRSSMGSLFRCSITNTVDLKCYLLENYKNFDFYGATLSAKIKIEEIKPIKKFGLIFGNESQGISKDLLSILTNEFLISGKGNAESLNVAVSVGVGCYYFGKYL